MMKFRDYLFAMFANTENAMNKTIPTIGSKWINRQNSTYISTVTALANEAYGPQAVVVIFKGDNGKTYSRPLDTWYDVWTPIDPVPKFKVGNWISYYNAERQVLGIKGKYYLLSLKNKPGRSTKCAINKVDHEAYLCEAPYKPKFIAGDTIILNGLRCIIDKLNDNRQYMITHAGVSQWKSTRYVDENATPYVTPYVPKYAIGEVADFGGRRYIVKNITPYEFYILQTSNVYDGNQSHVDVKHFDEHAKRVTPSTHKYAVGERFSYCTDINKLSVVEVTISDIDETNYRYILDIGNGRKQYPFFTYFERYARKIEQRTEQRFNTTGHITGPQSNRIQLDESVPDSIAGNTCEKLNVTIERKSENNRFYVIHKMMNMYVKCIHPGTGEITDLCIERPNSTYSAKDIIDFFPEHTYLWIPA